MSRQLSERRVRTLNARWGWQFTHIYAAHQGDPHRYAAYTHCEGLGPDAQEVDVKTGRVIRPIQFPPSWLDTPTSRQGKRPQAISPSTEERPPDPEWTALHQAAENPNGAFQRLMQWRGDSLDRGAE